MADKLHLQLGFIGLGSMGLGMSTCLQKHLRAISGRNLLYYNRTISRGLPLQEIGAVPAQSLQDLVSRCDIVFLSLSDDAALELTINSIIETTLTKQGNPKIIVDTTTVHPSSSVQASDRLATKGFSFVAAPVFGASPVAATGKLLWILAGPSVSIQIISPFILGVMGRSVMNLGDNVQRATGLKTIGNMITASFMEVVAEATVFAERMDIPGDSLQSLFEQQYGPLALSRSQRLTSGAYLPARDSRPWSSLDLALKDVGHGLSCAEQFCFELPVGQVAMDHLRMAADYGRQESRALDSSSMYGILRQKAGLPFETKLVQHRDQD